MLQSEDISCGRLSFSFNGSCHWRSSCGEMNKSVWEEKGVSCLDHINTHTHTQKHLCCGKFPWCLNERVSEVCVVMGRGFYFRTVSFLLLCLWGHTSPFLFSHSWCQLHQPISLQLLWAWLQQMLCFSLKGLCLVSPGWGECQNVGHGLLMRWAPLWNKWMSPFNLHIQSLLQRHLWSVLPLHGRHTAGAESNTLLTSPQDFTCCLIRMW